MRSQKKILILTHHFPPETVGRSSRINGLVEFLKNRFDITVIAPPPSVPFTYFKKVNYLFHLEHFKDYKLQRIWTYQPSKSIPSSLQILANYLIFPILTSFFLVTKLKNFSTVLVATPPEFLLLIVPLIRLFRKKLIIDVGDLPIEVSTHKGSVKQSNLSKKFLKNFQIECWKKADLIITNSNIVYEEIQKFVKDPQKIEYFPFNVDSNKFKKQNIPREKKIIYPGMISPAQNIESFIKSMAIVIKKIPDLKFEIYGWGKSAEEIKKLISNMKIENSCIIKKPVSREKIPEILSKSMVGLIPLDIHDSLRYAMPTKTFEYMSCSLPIFSYGSSDELRKLIEKSNAGVFVKSNDPKELAQKLIDFLEDTDSLEKYASNGRKFIENQSDHSDLISQI